MPARWAKPSSSNWLHSLRSRSSSWDSFARWASPWPVTCVLEMRSFFNWAKLTERGQRLVVDQGLREKQFLELGQSAEFRKSLFADPKEVQSQDLQVRQLCQPAETLVIDLRAAVLAGQPQRAEAGQARQMGNPGVGDFALAQVQRLQRGHGSQRPQSGVGDPRVGQHHRSHSPQPGQMPQSVVVDRGTAKVHFQHESVAVTFQALRQGAECFHGLRVVPLGIFCFRGRLFRILGDRGFAILVGRAGIAALAAGQKQQPQHATHAGPFHVWFLLLVFRQ